MKLFKIMAAAVILLTPQIPSTPLTPVGVQQPLFPNEPAPYPEGVFCTPKGDNVHGFQTEDHPCSCHNMMREDKYGCCDEKVTNDPVCKQWCTEKNCRCPVECIPGRPDETQTPNAEQPKG